MPSIDELHVRFDADQRRRGRESFRRKQVRILERAPDLITAHVQGESVYVVRLRLESGRWTMACTCPAFEHTFACKHAWAVLLAVDAEAGDADEAAAVATSGKRARASDASDLDEQLRALEPHDDGPPPEPVELRYVLHSFARGPEEWSTLGFLVGAASTSRLRSAYPSAREQSTLSVEDQRVLAMLPPSPWSWRTAQAGPGSREIPRVLEAPVLELAARTGRLYLGEERNVGKHPLVFDDGPPWTLAVSLRRDGAQVVLSAHLARGGEKLDLARCQRVLAGGVVVAGNRLALADWRGAWTWVPTLRRAGSIRADADQAHRLLATLRTAPGNPAVEASEFVRELPRATSGVVQIEAVPRFDGALSAQLLFQYGTVRCRADDPSRSSWVQRGDALYHLLRDDAREAELRDDFVAAGAVVDPVGVSTVSTTAFPAFVRALTSRGWVVEADGKRVRVDGKSSSGIASGVDWFDLETKLDFDGLSPGMPELLRAARERTHLVRLSDGSVGMLPEEWLKRWSVATRLGSLHGDKLRFKKSLAWLLDAWIAENEEGVDVDAKFERVRENLRRCAAPAERREPHGFRGELRPYQREGLGWMHFLSEASLGGILADDMGLGKTVQVLALLLERRERARGPALVVAPLSVLFNWEREAQRFAPGLRVVRHHGSQRARSTARIEDADLVVTSYGTLRMDVGTLKQVRFDCAVLDEAQTIKNQDSQSAKAARLLDADLRLALSGTPVENHLGELVSILRFVNPEIVEGSRAFADALSGPRGDVETARVVARAVRPFLLRRTKEQVAPELPPKTEQVVTIELEGEERRAYDELRARFAAEILRLEAQLGLESIGMHVLEALLRLRQAACHPGLLDPSRAGEGSAKLDTLLDRLEEVVESGHKALVFSQFTTFLGIVRDRLDARGVRYEYLDGKTRDREARVRSFQEDADVPLFLVSLKAGGAGLNLTAADYVFLLDPWWNPAVEAQAIDRTHRIGRLRPVTAYRLIARDTIEDKVRELQERKRELADALYADAGTSLRDLSRADLAWLLGDGA